MTRAPRAAAVTRMVMAGLVAAASLVPVFAQAQAQSPEAAAARAAVERFLDVLGNRELDALPALLAPQATLNVARFRDGRWTHTAQTRDEWVGALRAQPAAARFREPLTNISVHVEDGQLAHLRAHFTIVIDGTIQSHGVDHFTLVNAGGGWLVANLSYTNLPGPPK
jgi:ketosteroid isomerase-like protein